MTAKEKKVSKPKIPSGLVGAAGEHFVMYQLYKRGLMVGQPPQGVADVDLLVLDEKANIVKSIQVKARSKGADGGWHMKAKHEELRNPRLWFVFVDMEPVEPICYVMPSSVVAKIVQLSHSIWLGLPGFPDGWMDQYRERWDLLLS